MDPTGWAFYRPGRCNQPFGRLGACRYSSMTKAVAHAIEAYVELIHSYMTSLIANPISLASRYGSSGVFWPRIRSQLTLAHDAALVRLFEALYLIFKLSVAGRQSLDHYICLIRDVEANRVRGKQPLAELESVLRHKADTSKCE